MIQIKCVARKNPLCSSGLKLAINKVEMWHEVIILTPMCLPFLTTSQLTIEFFVVFLLNCFRFSYELFAFI
jgi:hypothetical protein